MLNKNKFIVKKCLECDNTWSAHPVTNKQMYCSTICKQNAKYSNKLENLDYVTCKVCGYKSNQLAGHITQKHKITTSEYKEKFPNSLTISENQSKEYSKKISGNKNPWVNHGGKYSPWTKGSINYSEEAIKKANENRSYNTTIEYWLNKGLSETEAKEAVSNRQRTFTLEKCIERYGEEGIKIYNARQIRWQETLNSKSDEEKAEINKKKATNLNFKILWNGEKKNKKARLYVVQKSDNLIKIGITTHSIKQRFGKIDFENLRVLLDLELTLGIAFYLEQLSLRKFKKYRIVDEYTTENLDIICLNDLLFYIEQNRNKDYETLYEEIMKFKQ